MLHSYAPDIRRATARRPPGVYPWARQFLAGERIVENPGYTAMATGGTEAGAFTNGRVLRGNESIELFTHTRKGNFILFKIKERSDDVD